MIVRIFAASVMALLAGSLVERARADQAFICDDGSLIQVKPADIERMRRENACVAKYLGPARETTPTTETSEPREPAPRDVANASIPLPARKPKAPALRTTLAAPSAAPRSEPARIGMVRILNAGKDEPKWVQPGR